MNATPDNLTWLSFDCIPSGPGAATAAACCAFSLSTLEVASRAGDTCFALTEHRQPETWRWAIVGPDHAILEEGCEPTQDEAKASAKEALILVADGGAEPSNQPFQERAEPRGLHLTLPATG